MNKLHLKLLVLVILLTGCLRTRSELGETTQSNVYSEKNAANQMEAQKNNGEPSAVAANGVTSIDEKDELIRNLNGRVEVLENQLTSLQKEREEEKIQNEQKLTLLQEAITKLTNGDTETESNSADKKTNSKENNQESSQDNEMLSSDQVAEKKLNKKENTVVKADKSEKKLSPYDAAESFFEKKEWKKAILSFHKYTDETPKGKLVPEAKYKIGVCFQELGMKDEAMAYFEEVVANYNSTEAGKKSKSRLTKLKK